MCLTQPDSILYGPPQRGYVHRLHLNRLLSHSIEHAPVEAEGEFLATVVQVLLAMQSSSVEIGYPPLTDATNARTIFLDGHDDKCVVAGQPTRDTCFLAPSIRRVHLDQAPQTVLPRPNHRPAEPGEQSPSGFVTAEPKRPLQSLGADAFPFVRDKPHRSKPRRRRQSPVLKDRACHSRGLMPAVCIQPKVAPHRPRPAPTERWATKPSGQCSANKY